MTVKLGKYGVVDASYNTAIFNDREAFYFADKECEMSNCGSHQSFLFFTRYKKHIQFNSICSLSNEAIANLVYAGANYLRPFTADERLFLAELSIFLDEATKQGKGVFYALRNYISIHGRNVRVGTCRITFPKRYA